MKLSGHDKKRLRWGVGILLGGAGLLYAYVHLVLTPLVVARDANRNEDDTLRAEIEQSRVDFCDATTLRQEAATVQEAYTTDTNLFVLRPVLGSLLMGAQRLLEPVAQDCGLQMDPCVEKGRFEIPPRRGDGEKRFERYAMDVTLQGSYRALADFIRTLERTNAFLCVSDIDIQGRPENPLRHKATIRIEWPVAVENRLPTVPSGKGGNGSTVPADPALAKKGTAP